ncbi:endothelial differentiation-related factor 1 homolog [Haliotis rufescens]|uniref:endothelial differentiation-related factor 1 homolog n=1 Tax=Haliotis rufescens TaxID=6454 RepID=UPI001EAFA4CD|nr:endothelial differentiation-related factor 1 homolog [Haliotis rufescens]
MAAACDFDVVTIGKKHKGGQRSKEAVNSAMRQGGDVDTQKKFSAGANKQSSANKNTAKLDRETDELHHEHVPLDVSKLIQLSRQNKGFTQKELATKINEKPQVINEYESGKAIPNQQVFGKLERVLGVKLRGKDKGKPLGAGPKK